MMCATSPVPPPSMVVFSARSMYSPGQGMSQGDSFGTITAARLLPLTGLSYGAILGEIFPASDVEVDHEQMFYCLSRSATHLGEVQEMLLLSGATHYHRMTRL